MRCTRLYLDTPLTPGANLELDERSAHHVSRVLRMKPGSRVQLFDGHGTEVRAELINVEKRRVSVHIESRLDRSMESPLQVVLGQGISKGERMDFTLQKSVELGAQTIVPLWTEHSQVQLDAQRLAKRMAHWQGVIISACEQCGRNLLPSLMEPMRVADWVQGLAPEDLGLLLDPEQPTSLAQLAAPAGRIQLLVGPEGGLSAQEQQQARAAGFVGIGLGPRILRTETAALAALAGLQALWGDFR